MSFNVHTSAFVDYVKSPPLKVIKILAERKQENTALLA